MWVRLIVTLGACQFLDGLVIVSPWGTREGLFGAPELALWWAIELIPTGGRQRTSLVKSRLVCLVDLVSSKFSAHVEPTWWGSPKLAGLELTRGATILELASTWTKWPASHRTMEKHHVSSSTLCIAHLNTSLLHCNIVCLCCLGYCFITSMCRIFVALGLLLVA